MQVAREGNLEERIEVLQGLRSKIDARRLAEFDRRLDMSWIYHDSALEGVVYPIEELQVALASKAATEALSPAQDEIRQHYAAIHLIRDLAEKKRTNIDLDTLKKIYQTLAPDEEDAKGPLKYRKDMPVHRLYFHDILPPDKIAPAMRTLFQWLKAPETKRSTHPVRVAAKAHSKMLEIYPFTKHSGKSARLLMNLILLRHGYPPCVIHSTERQRYYDALKVGQNAVAALVHESIVGSVERSIRHFEDLRAS